MRGRVRTLLTWPNAAIEDDPTGLGGPATAVFVLGVVAVGGTLIPGLVVVGDVIAPYLPDSPPVTLATGGETVTVPTLLLQIMVAALVAPFVIWALTAAVLHGGLALAAVVRRLRTEGLVVPVGRPSRASLRDGFEAYRRTLVVVGWGVVPQVLASLFTAALFVPTAVLATDPGLVGTQLTAAGHTVVRSPEMPLLTLATHAVGIASVLWTGFVWFEGLQAIRDVPRRATLVVVGVVAGVVLAISDLDGLLVFVI